MHSDLDSQGLPNGLPNTFCNVGQTHDHSWSTILCCTCARGQCRLLHISKRLYPWLLRGLQRNHSSVGHAAVWEQASPPHRHMLHAPHTHTTTVSQMTKAKLTSRGYKIVTATLDEEWKKLTAPLGTEGGTALWFWECLCCHQAHPQSLWQCLLPWLHHCIGPRIMNTWFLMFSCSLPFLNHDCWTQEYLSVQE